MSIASKLRSFLGSVKSDVATLTAQAAEKRGVLARLSKQAVSRVEVEQRVDALVNRLAAAVLKDSPASLVHADFDGAAAFNSMNQPQLAVLAVAAPEAMRNLLLAHADRQAAARGGYGLSLQDRPAFIQRLQAELGDLEAQLQEIGQLAEETQRSARIPRKGEDGFVSLPKSMEVVPSSYADQDQASAAA